MKSIKLALCNKKIFSLNTMNHKYLHDSKILPVELLLYSLHYKKLKSQLLTNGGILKNLYWKLSSHLFYFLIIVMFTCKQKQENDLEICCSKIQGQLQNAGKPTETGGIQQRIMKASELTRKTSSQRKRRRMTVRPRSPPHWARERTGSRRATSC